MHPKIVLLYFLFLSFSRPAFASDFYVNSAGNDANAGTSPALAWRTTGRVHTARLQPGDRVLLAGGQVFRGGLWLREGSRGTASQPIVFRSYGTGRATIQSDSAFGFYAHNAAGIEVRQLNFAGAGRMRNGNSGVIFYLDSANAHLQHLRLDSLSVSGYRNAGVSIGSWNGLSGYAGVRVTSCELRANGEAGLSSYAYYPAQGLAHHNWYVGNCAAFDNAGRADVTSTHTGSGIVLAGIDGAVIEKCVAYHNGWLNANPGGGPVGIWGWCCNNLVIQDCESHHNLSGTTKDGGGFDLDGGCTNSVLQYNYSHDNQGPGFLLAQFPGAPAMHNLTVRYNISENDARQHDQGAIELYSSGSNGGIVRADLYNKTVYLTRPADGSVPKAVYMLGDGVTGIALRNNILQTAAGLPVLATGTATGLRLEGNCYWTPNAPLPLLGVSLLIRCYAQRWLRQPGEGGLHLAGGLLRIGSWWVYTSGFVYAVLGVRVPYLPTPKEGRRGNEWRLALPNLVLATGLLAACKYGRVVAYGPYTNVMVALALFNMAILVAATFMGQHRVVRNFVADMATRPYRGLVLGLHRVLAALAAALVPLLRRFGPAVAVGGLALTGALYYRHAAWLARVPPEWLLTGVTEVRVGQDVAPIRAAPGTATFVGQ